MLLWTGRSLLWVAVLGVIWLYIYALVGFGFFRPVFDPQNELYCASLLQCTVTIIRYGPVGDIDEVSPRMTSSWRTSAAVYTSVVNDDAFRMSLQSLAT